MDLSSDAFSATLEHLDGQAVIVLRGDLDMESAPQLAEMLGQFLDDGPPEIVLNLSGLSFIDSSGLSVLIMTQNALISQERRLVIRSPRPQALKVFEITAVAQFLNVDVAELPT